MRELALAGLVAVVFGLGSFYATKELSAFSAVNLAGGSLLLLVAGASGLRRLRIAGGPFSRRVVARGALWVALALAVGVGLERGAASTGVRFDWTFEQAFELSPATEKALRELEGPVTALLFHDEYDPRTRRTRLLLRQLAEHGPVEVRDRLLTEAPDEADRYAVGSSNSVVLVRGDAFETVSRPTEGALYEALYRLSRAREGTLVFLRGEGEGELDRRDELGYSGLAAALDTEGYRLRSVVSAALEAVPEGTDAVVVLGAERRLPESALSALARYLEAGGRLVAMLEPGQQSGVEELLADWGLLSPNAVLVDPASGALESQAEGLAPVAHNFETHPITRGLDDNRMTFFAGVRPFELVKPRVEDELEGVVLASHRSFVREDLSLLERTRGSIDPDGARQTYHPIVAAGRYPREGRDTRIVAFGDADFASNRYLRALYNLDLVLNAVHWATEREADITLRPKIRDTVQFPLPLANTLQTLYGVGLLVPELLLVAGGVVWLRRRSA